MIEQINGLLREIIKREFDISSLFNFSRTDQANGDFASNAALQLSGKLSRPPREIAEVLAEKLRSSELVVDATVAGPGFINIRVADSLLAEATWQSTSLPKVHTGKRFVTEYSDPNPFKVLHAGHLYTTLVGDAISNIIEASGAEVVRTNFGGDVGLHVARAMWGILQVLGGEKPQGLDQIPDAERPAWISAQYVAGNTAYEADESARAEIIALNQRIYQIHKEGDKASDFARIYWTCRQWSYDGFAKLYDDLEVHPFDKYYPESVTTPPGERLVDTALKDGVLEESEGAVVYKGEKDGLHTRVFRNKAGLPTYEAKDLGLNDSKIQDFNFDVSVIITGNDIIEYMKVVLKVMSHFSPDIEAKTVHLTHGLVKLPGGKKMSSRAGSVVLADDILTSAYAASGSQDRQVVLGAIRYSFLKARLGGDIVYDPDESVSMEGNSGPYLQYALVRARSILRKIAEEGGDTSLVETADFDEFERALALKLTGYREVFELAVDEYAPHHICNYLYELAQVFNRFYENCRVIGDQRFALRARLTTEYEAVLAHGLGILGMPKPEKM